VTDLHELVVTEEHTIERDEHPRSPLPTLPSAITDDDLPWWRVVNSAGRLVPGHEREQSQLLRAEDVTVGEGRVRRAPIGRFSRPSRP
jgi:alkylated DNA nucleotide flippase Atl1